MFSWLKRLKKKELAMVNGEIKIPRGTKIDIEGLVNDGMIVDKNEYRFNDLPKEVGAYVLGKGCSTVSFHFQHKPFIIHRWFMFLLLGFKWVDNDN